MRYFGDQLDSLAPGCVNLNAKPSQIGDLSTGKILRPS